MDEINYEEMNNADLANMKSIASLVIADKHAKNDKYRARKYYYYKHKPTTTSISMEIDGKLVDKKVSSNKLYINYFKMLVNQKIDYLMSKPITFSEDIKVPNFTPLQLQDILEQGSLNASLDSATWLHLFINEQKQLDWMYIFDAEIIELKQLKHTYAIIRYYNIKKDDKKLVKVEIWTQNVVTTFIFDGTNIESVSNITTLPHFVAEKEYQGTVETTIAGSFGFIPFIQLYNNKAHESDIEDVESLISVYNSISNGYIENIEEFQEALMLLKGVNYDDEELKSTMNKIKKYKAVGLPDGTDIQTLKVEIPVEARRVILSLIEENIYNLGRGFNPNQIGDGNITNVVIQSRYANLDNKANDTEKQLQLFYERLMTAVNTYYNIKTLPGQAVFNRTQIINESQKIEDCVNSKGIISDETIRKNHPWNNDDEVEQARLASEKERLVTEKETVTERIQESTENV